MGLAVGEICCVHVFDWWGLHCFKDFEWGTVDFSRFCLDFVIPSRYRSEM